MAYSEISDLTRWAEEDEIVQLASKSDQATILSPEVIDVLNEVIASADGEIDSYLLGRWPSLRTYSPVPDEINRLSAQMAVYYLYLRRRAMSDDWLTQYKACLSKLQKASEGKLSLGLDADGKQAAEPEAQYRTDALDTDDDLDDDDPRKYTKGKLGKL